MSRRLFPPAQNTAGKAHKLRDKRKGRRSKRSRPLGCHIEYSWHKLSRPTHAPVCGATGNASFSDISAVFCIRKSQRIWSKLYTHGEKCIFYWRNYVSLMWRNFFVVQTNSRNLHDDNINVRTIYSVLFWKTQYNAIYMGNHMYSIFRLQRISKEILSYKRKGHRWNVGKTHLSSFRANRVRIAEHR